MADLLGTDETALVLHTSGTTSRPKIVPLTQGNLIASANNIATHLRLISADRCLNIMPLFHIHGLVAAVLATLSGGGSVFCTPGFNALKFFGWMEECKAHLVHGGADHAPGDPVPGRKKCDCDQGQSPAAHPLKFRLAARASLHISWRPLSAVR